MLNVLPLTVRSSSVAAPWTPPIAAALVAGSVIVAIAPVCARKPNGPQSQGGDVQRAYLAAPDSRVSGGRSAAEGEGGH
jgi:hypothetical protein